MSSELEKGLFSMLSGNSPQTAAGSRIYPRLPQGVTHPAIRYQRISTGRNLALDGAVGVTAATVQIDCRAESYSAAKALADEVRGILHAYRGPWGALTARLVSLESENDLEYVDGDDVIHWVAQRYRIHTNMD